MQQPQSSKDIITHLKKNRQKLNNSLLAELTDLSGDALSLFSKEWQDISPERRYEITSRMVELAEEDAVLSFDSIFKILLKDPDEEIRLQAIQGLWENEQPSLARLFIKIMNSDRSPEVQASATQALGRFTLLAECKELEPDLVLELQELLDREVEV